MTTYTFNKETFFETKEQYLAFRNAWSKAVNSPKAKPHHEPCAAWIDDRYAEDAGTMKVKGWIKASHHILFNILTGKHIANGFTLTTNKNKLANGGCVNDGFYFAYQALNRMVGYAEKALKDSANNADKLSWHEKRIQKFLEPFDGTVTIDMLCNLDIPMNNIPRIHPEGKEGREMLIEARKTRNSTPLPKIYISSEDLWEAYA